MSWYTTYTHSEAIQILKFLALYAVAWFVVVGWLWWRGRGRVFK